MSHQFIDLYHVCSRCHIYQLKQPSWCYLLFPASSWSNVCAHVIKKNWYMSLMWTAPAGISPADESLSTRPTYRNEISSPSYQEKKVNARSRYRANSQCNGVRREVRTSAGGLRLVPLGIVGVHAFNGDRALFQSVSRVAGKLHHGPHCPGAVAAGQVTVLHKRFVAVARRKCWAREKTEKVFPNSDLQFVQQQCQWCWSIGPT